MMNTTTNIQKYIKLKTPTEIGSKFIKRWYKTVVNVGPANIVSSVSVIRENEPAEVKMTHTKSKGVHVYTVPLKRDLVDNEVSSIVNQWENIYDEDFDIEASQTEISSIERNLDDAIVIDPKKYEDFCEELAKSQHSLWVKNRTDDGWRYGEVYSSTEKTHPMLKPWNELPDKYKDIDEDTPQLFIKKLNEMGYSVIKTTELEKLKSK